MNLFRPGSAIPLFRCLADADSGICAALAFGKRARRMTTLPARAAVGNHIARGTAAQNLFDPREVGVGGESPSIMID